MKILLLSDLGGKSPALPPDHVQGIDFVLLAGDITLDTPRVVSARQFFSNARLLFPQQMRVFYIPGNHDYPFVAQEHPWVPPNFILMHNRYTRFRSLGFSRDVLIIGFGGAKIGLYNNFAFSEDEIRISLSKLFQKAAHDRTIGGCFTILFVHDSPFNNQLDLTSKGQHAGSESVRHAIETYMPDLAVSGHIHESPGVDVIGQTTCVNAGEGKYGRHAIIAVDDDGVNTTLY